MENKHTPEGKWITRVMHGKLYVVVEIGHNDYHAIATVHDSSVENAELIAYAPSLQSEIDRLEKVSGEDDIKILTLEDHVRNLESEIDRLKEENKALVEALITCSKEDDKYSYIVARCTLKNYNHPH